MQKWFMCRIYTHIDLRMKTKKEIHDKTIRLIPLSVAIPLNILVLVLLSSLLVIPLCTWMTNLDLQMVKE